MPVQAILLLHKSYRKQNRRLIQAEVAVWRTSLVKVALDLNHVRVRGLGMGGRRAGEKGVENIKTYSKRKQKLVVCLAKQMLLLVLVKLCVLELCICLRKVSNVLFGYVLLEFAGRLFGALLRRTGPGDREWGRRLLACPLRRLATAGWGSSYWAKRQG